MIVKPDVFFEGGSILVRFHELPCLTKDLFLGLLRSRCRLSQIASARND